MLQSEIEQFPDLLRSALEQADSSGWTYIWAVHTLPKLERWVSAGGKVVVIGDAAHTIIPAAGYVEMDDGCNLGAALTLKADKAQIRVWRMLGVSLKFSRRKVVWRSGRGSACRKSRKWPSCPRS